ncbi:hypothetical protein [Rhodoplanes sp. SY1]|uniref:hypothetical protein n=1 Tax=Rhodoplanes sp. SY1 TaxID=3166646 RepID=UPI0038B54BCE
MSIASRVRAASVAAAVVAAGVLAAGSAAQADSGSVSLTIYKGGWVIGGSGGSGTLTFQGKRYRLSIGGLSAGLVFGASKANLYGRVSNISRPSDVAGVYGAAGAGGALGPGAQAIVLRNQKGAVLELQGRQVGLIANLDLSGMALSLR